MPYRNSSTPKYPARKHMENMAKAAFSHSARKTGSLSGTSTRPRPSVPPQIMNSVHVLLLTVLSRHPKRGSDDMSMSIEL